jgi:hypothetical protein
MTVTGTVGGLAFATWAGGDHLWSRARRRRAPQPATAAPAAAERPPAERPPTQRAAPSGSSA